MTAMIASLAELPFERRDALALLHLDGDRDAPDPDYVGFGHARVGALTLAGRGGAVVVRDALVLALHCADPGEALDDDVELEFVLDPAPDGRSVSARLSRFLAVWLPRLADGERAVVLALCNPRRADVPRPAALPPGVALYYGVGDVESWYDGGVRLRAEAWRVAR